MMQILFISILVVMAMYFFGGARRHAQAVKASDRYLANFSQLADSANVPLPILETFHKAFETACHPCAITYLAKSVIRYRFDSSFRALIENQEKPKHLENLDPITLAKISATAVSLFLYASYSVPIIGMIIRPLILKTAIKSQSGTKKEVGEKVRFFVFNTEHLIGV